MVVHVDCHPMPAGGDIERHFDYFLLVGLGLDDRVPLLFCFLLDLCVVAA